jgi:hypothetical protein
LPEFDFEGSLRWVRGVERKTIRRRALSALPFFDPLQVEYALLLDTSVYVDRLQGKITLDLRQFLEANAHHHSTVALQEMMLAVGALDPRDFRTKATVNSIGALIELIRPHRLHQPDIDVCGRAALLAGTLSRIQGYGKDNRSKALNDCTLFLHAQKMGTTLLTRNYADFDILLQMIPSGRVLFY